jgi:hypothetical protein
MYVAYPYALALGRSPHGYSRGFSVGYSHRQRLDAHAGPYYGPDADARAIILERLARIGLRH